MKEFLFQPEQARTPIRNLSGGERARLILARNLARSANLIVLDEPTNDLDMETLDLLQEIVAGFAGTVLLVSHDRDFLDRTVTSTIAPAETAEPDGRWLVFAGGYSDMLAQCQATDDRAKPRVVKAPNAPAAQRSPDRKAKLSYKQKFALEMLPGRISEGESKAAQLEQKMADPALFARDPETFQRLADALSTLRQELAAMEEEWLELEMLRESLENGTP